MTRKRGNVNWANYFCQNCFLPELCLSEFSPKQNMGYWLHDLTVCVGKGAMEL
jgi:hypothetical protein